jgi:hypothetical protein
MRRVLLPALVLALIAAASASSGRKATPAQIELSPSSPPLAPAPRADARQPQALSPATSLYLWTFDDGSGQADPQGWTTVDRTVQPAYFHVDDFAGMNPLEYAPLSGSKSLWCGRRACDTPTDCPMTTDGYGNNWLQYFVSMPFAVSGDVPISFSLSYDCEASYDSLSLYYAASDGVLHHMRTWTGSGFVAVNEVVPASAHTGLVSFAFRFKSDGVWSDEDGILNSLGAATIDDILVGDALNPIDSQGFDNAANGATYTPDYHWFASSAPEEFGNYAGLCDADTVLQEDPGHTNSTHAWSFFNGSTDHYTCGGHPEQLAVPLMRTTNGLVNALHNEVQSPPMSIVGFPSGHAMVLSFDVYRDMPLENMVAFTYRIRSRVGGIWRPWIGGSTTYYDPAKVWRAASFNIQSLVRPGATDIQVALAARDICPIFCGPLYPGSCHSQGPLFDNVRLIDGNTVVGPGAQNLTPVDETTGTTPVTVTFFGVSAAGNTTLVTSSAGPPAPGAFMIGDGTYYDLSTTATAGGLISVCIQYNEATLPVPEGQLRMLHWDTALNPDRWVDVTDYVDTANNVICGVTSHLSPFVIGGGSLTGVGDGAAPRSFALHQNTPNPFNPNTTITYDVPDGGVVVTIRVYDAAGRLVRTLVDGPRAAGTHATTWDGRNQSGHAVSSGVYFYKMTAGSFVESRRMVLLK